MPGTGNAGSAMVAGAAKCTLYFFSEEHMIRSRVFAPLLGTLVGAAVLGAPTLARADFELRITDVTTATVVVFKSNTNFVSTGGLITVGNADVDASGFAGNGTTSAFLHLHVATLSDAGVVPDEVKIELTKDNFVLGSPPVG